MSSGETDAGLSTRARRLADIELARLLDIRSRRAMGLLEQHGCR